MQGTHVLTLFVGVCKEVCIPESVTMTFRSVGAGATR